MELGADDYLTKPFTNDELLNAVQTRLARQMTIFKNREEEIEQAKKNLVQSITRELRAPMESIDLVQELIERQMGRLTPQDLRDFLETLRSGSRRIRHVVDQIVYLTQIQTGVLRYDALMDEGVTVSLWGLAAEAVKTARRFAHRSRDASVVLHERDEEKLWVRCHPPALEHALAELITNALNYSPANSVVEVLVWKSNDIAQVSISNQGGISTDRFVWDFHDDAPQADTGAGKRLDIGLGLPLAHRIIAEHGGTLELDTTVDSVTRVVISLPLAHQSSP
jgi:signal transduction histidine kinase